MNVRLHICACAAVFLVFQACASQAFAQRPSYFSDLSETKSSELNLFPKWTTMVSRYVDQRQWPPSDCDKRQFYPCRVEEWKQMLDGLSKSPLTTQMEKVNRFINRYPYVIDQINWGVDDYWETPYEHITIGGDCEDFAIAKYYSLRYMGVPDDQLRIIIVQDFNLGGIIHAILGVYNEQGDLYLLDNQIKQVVSANRVYHYKPIYGINESGWWAYHTY